MVSHKQIYAFRSNLSAKNCLENIEGGLSKKTAWKFLLGRDNRDIVGKVTENRFIIYARVRFGGSNPFYPIFDGHVTEVGVTTTEVEGSFHMNPLIKWFLVMWISLFATAVLALGVIYVVSVMQHNVYRAEYSRFWILPALLMLIAQAFAYMLRIPMIKSDKKAILRFIQDTCEATPYNILTASILGLN